MEGTNLSVPMYVFWSQPDSQTFYETDDSTIIFTEEIKYKTDNLLRLHNHFRTDLGGNTDGTKYIDFFTTEFGFSDQYKKDFLSMTINSKEMLSILPNRKVKIHSFSMSKVTRSDLSVCEETFKADWDSFFDSLSCSPCSFRIQGQHTHQHSCRQRIQTNQSFE